MRKRPVSWFLPPVSCFPTSVVARLLLLALALFPASTLAQARPLGEPATQGVRNPSVGVASDGDASSIEKNPAQLGYLRAWSGVYLHTELESTGTVSGRGDGFFFAMPVPYLSSLVLGGAVQLSRPPDGFPYADLAKISLALSWRVHELLSFGLHYAHLVSDKAPVAGGVDTLDLALAGHLGRYLAWALVVRDVPSPSVGGIPMQRVYDPEIAIRPFGIDRLELGIGARFGERRGDIDPHFRLWAVLYKGISLKADVDWRRDLDLDGIPENDVRVALGLQLDLERVGVSGFGLFGREAGQVEGQGFSLAARFSGERYPTFYRGPRYLERVELTKELKGRRLLQLLDRLRHLERDDEAGGVILIGGELGAGLAGAEELRAALLRLRKRGRHVIAYLQHADTKGYLVATAAERIVLDPAGDLALTGAAFTLPFFKGTGELFGVRADFVRIGAYKSAPERYTHSEPSPESRASRETYLDDLWRHLVDAIAASRNLPPQQVRARIDAGPYTPSAALAAHLVDDVLPGEELGQVVAGVAGRELSVHDAPRAPVRDESWSEPRIAVIHVEGDLVGGASHYVPWLELRATGMKDLIEALDGAARDPRTRAIVLRIDSPGGSFLVADLVAREVTRIRAWKPVICSLGDVAASGGYYIAAACDEIFAAPSTLAGSIGIYTGKFDLSGLAAKLGVSLTTMQRGAHAGMTSLFRPYTDEERQSLLTLLRACYQRFVATVARGRHLSEARVDELGQGRIYSGDRAIALELADRYGGLSEAIEAAAARSGAKSDIAIQILPEPVTVLGQLGHLLGLKLPERRSETQAAAALLPGLTDLLAAIPASIVFEPSVPQARLDVEAPEAP